MKKSVRLKAFCKANLSLDITGKDGISGLHELDSVMMSLDCFDVVTVTERDDKRVRLSVTGADLAGGKNTAVKAAEAVMRAIDCNGFDISIEKNIPIGAGLGGSSADGAAVLRALDLFYGLTKRGVDMREIALGIGSDVPFMLTGGLARVRGKGEDLFFIQNKLKLFVVGLFGGEVSTARAYAEFDRLYPTAKFSPSNSDKLCESALDGDATGVLRHLGNALYEPAKIIAPEVPDCAQKLADCGASVNMTGSGGMVLGYFTDMQKFCDCVRELKKDGECRVYTSARTGVLHERLF